MTGNIPKDASGLTDLLASRLEELCLIEALVVLDGIEVLDDTLGSTRVSHGPYIFTAS